MSKLISAGFLRLRKCRVFYIVCAAAFVINLALVYTESQNYELYSASQELCLFDHVPMIGLICSVFIGLMLGSEYGDGTVRNKIMVGHKRVCVYLSYLVVSVAGALVITVVCMSVTVVFWLAMFRSIAISAAGFFWLFFCELMLTAASAAGAVLVMACTRSRATTAVMCIIVALVLLFAGAYMSGRLEEQPTVSYYVMTNEYGVPTQVEERPNPRYVSGAARTALELACEFDPAGQAILISNFSASHPERLPVMSLLFIIVTTAAGCAVFRKKDLI